MIKGEPKIETKVIGAEKSKENFVSYIVKVTAQIPPNLSVSWTVARRYEQFREFAGMMEKKISKSKATLPKLTGKSLHASSQSLVSKRLKKLNAYLEDVARIPEVSHSHEWCCFLSSSFQDLFRIPLPPAYVASYSSYQPTEVPTTTTSSTYQPDSSFEPSSLTSSISDISSSYPGGHSSFMPSYLNNSSSSATSSQSSPTSSSTTSSTAPPSPKPEKRGSISFTSTSSDKSKKDGKEKEQLVQTIAELERKLLEQKTETRRAVEQANQIKRENEDLHQRVQLYSSRAHELETDIKQYVEKVRWVPDADRNMCPYCKQNFSLFFRRHHCRACGEVCCSRCSDTNYENLSRVCVGCKEGTSLTSRTRSTLGMKPLVPTTNRSASFSTSRTLSSSSSGALGSGRTLSSSSQSRYGQTSR